jgi:hypothetical protein
VLHLHLSDVQVRYMQTGVLKDVVLDLLIQTRLRGKT